MKKLSLGDRIKSYEATNRYMLNRRSYTVIRLDGVSFSKYTKGISRPFNKGIMEDMIETTKYLCEKVQGCKLGYTQSDEITLILTDFDNYDSQPWFDNQVQKIVSVASGLATAKFNQLRYVRALQLDPTVDITKMKLPSFDARVFQVPTLIEVNNVLIWRQRDFVRNSIATCAQSLFSSTVLHGKNSGELQELIFTKSEELVEKLLKCGFDTTDMPLDKKTFNWNDLRPNLKRGTTFMLVENDKGKKVWEASAFEYSSKTADQLSVGDNSKL